MRVNKIGILYQCDNNYAPFVGVSMTSLFINNEAVDMVVYIMDDGISQENWDKYNTLANKYGRTVKKIDTTDITKFVSNLNMPKYRGGYTTYFKLFIESVLDEDIDRLLYVDGDTLFLNNISELCDIDMQDYPLAMVMDSIIMDYNKRYYDMVDVPYYNAGMILYNLRVWKEEKWSDVIVNHVTTVRADYPTHDQDIINIVFKDKIMTLNPKFNFEPLHYILSAEDYLKIVERKVYYSKLQLEEAKTQPVILHFFRFLGEFPWNKDNNHPYRHIYEEYCDKSLWSESGKEIKRDRKLIFKVETFIYLHFSKKIFTRLFFAFKHLKYMVDKTND